MRKSRIASLLKEGVGVHFLFFYFLIFKQNNGYENRNPGLRGGEGSWKE